MNTVFLFDVDLTLLKTGGAGRRAMNSAFLRLHGRERAFEGIEVAGRTDGAILRECYTLHQLALDDLEAAFAAYRAVYLTELAAELKRSACSVLPGVVELLDVLAGRADVALGLGTGNYREAAELKLRHVDLWDRFLDGGFADDGEARPAVIASAARRTLAAAHLESAAIWVIGDSPHDVTAAKANGFGVVGVGTGHSTPEALLTAGADVAFPDLMDAAAFIAATLS